MWTPAMSNTERLPTMVWVHGGGYHWNGRKSAISAEMLAPHGAVVVVQLPLGALGFFAHPGLSRESDQKSQATTDCSIRSLLRWVRDNIAGFRRRPFQHHRVRTVSGRLFWSRSAHGLPARARLFHRHCSKPGHDWCPSARSRAFATYYGLPSAESKGAELVPDIATLRALSADEVIEKLPNARTFSVDWHFGPVIDGYVLPDDPGILLGTSGQAKVPLLIGHNADEAFFYRNESPRTLTGYRDFVANLIPSEFVATVLKMYPAADDAAATQAVLRMFSDFRFVTPTVLTARAAARVTDVYMYRFSRVSLVNQSTWGGAGHGVEIPYVFNHITAEASQYDEIDRTLSLLVAGAWVQFAKTGNPNGTGLPQWPQYRAPDYRLLEYGNEIGVQSNAMSSTIDFFRQVSESLRQKTTSPGR
jgi:para-nitrobenzyl esterase